MRRAAAQAVIAQVVTKHIFQPFNLPADQQAPAALILKLLEKDKRRLSIYRCQILKMCDTDDADEEVITAARDEAHLALAPFLPAPSFISFGDRLQALFADAVAVWRDAQYSRDIIVAEVVTTMLGGEDKPRSYAEYDSGTPKLNAPKTQVEEKPSIVAMLFPQIGNEDHIIHNGFALWSNQGAVLGAASEMSRPPGAIGSSEFMGMKNARRRSSLSVTASSPGLGITNVNPSARRE
jgi:hypothetical protein